MNAHTREHRDYGFVIGLLTGTFVGAGLAMWLAPPSASELRRRMTDSARSPGKRIAEQDQQGSARIGETVDAFAGKGQNVPDALTFPGEIVDRLTDTSAGLLILFGSPLAQTARRIGQSLAKL